MNSIDLFFFAAAVGKYVITWGGPIAAAVAVYAAASLLSTAACKVRARRAKRRTT